MACKWLIIFITFLSSLKTQEIDSICSLFNLSVNWLDKRNHDPYIAIECSEEDVRNLCSRSVLIRAAYELWVYSTDKTEFIEELKSCPRINDEQFSKSSFKIQVETFNKKISKETKVSKIEELDFLPFGGPIVMTNPANTFGRFEFYGLRGSETSEEPEKLFFGRFITNGQRDVISKHTLKKRKFISNTSMDPAISLIMANMAKVDNCDLVIDPFVGSGSLLVAAAHFGAHVVGTDIDFKLLYGLSKPTRAGCKERDDDESVEANLRQYDLGSKYVDIILSDASIPLFRQQFKWDAVICDPPYGIREASEKVGSKKDFVEIPDHLVPEHYPAKIHYNLEEIIKDLMNFCADRVKLGGRLLFWMPVIRVEGEDLSFDVPQHECLEVMEMVEQELSGNYSRMLICMEKIRERHEVDTEMFTRDLKFNNARRFRDNFYQSVRTRIQAKKVLKQTIKQNE